MIVHDVATLVRKLYDLYNTHQSNPDWLDQSLVLVADDFEVLDVPSGMTFRGREGQKQFLMGWATAFPDSTVEITNLAAGESHAVVEFTGRGTHTGTMKTPAGDIRATGRKIEIRFCDVHQIKDGKLSKSHTYYDVLGMMRQLGLISSQG